MPPIVVLLLTVLVFGALDQLAGRRPDRNQARRVVLAVQPVLIVLAIGFAFVNARGEDDPHGMGLFLSLLLTSFVAGACSLVVLQRFGWNVAFGLAGLSGAVGLGWMLSVGNWAAFVLLGAAAALTIVGLALERRESRATSEGIGTVRDDR
jgi:hypothetical protein